MTPNGSGAVFGLGVGSVCLLDGKSHSLNLVEIRLGEGTSVVNDR